ncbi:MAG TPA: hypothetical protein V6D48_17205 [Oculatellaceae cyanobacterium]
MALLREEERGGDKGDKEDKGDKGDKEDKGDNKIKSTRKPENKGTRGKGKNYRLPPLLLSSKVTVS